MISRKQLYFYILFLTVYSYEFSKTQQLTSVYNNHRTVFQYLGVIILGVGFFLFYVSRRLFPSISVRKWILMGFNVIYTVGLLFMLYVPGILYITWIVHLALGYLGGVVYYYIAAALGRTNYVGRVAMFGQSFSILLQMLLPKRIDDTGIVLAVLIIGFVVVTYLMVSPPADWMFEGMLPYAEETPAWNKEVMNRLTRLLFIVILADTFGCLVEISWTTVWETGNVDMYTFPRLFMIGGHLLAGVFADFKGHKYLDTALLIVLCFGLSGIYMTDYTTVRLCIFYLMAGFLILYMNIKFWHLAPYTNKPELWSGFGRILYVFEGLISEAFIKLLRGQTFFGMMLLTVILAGIVCLVLSEAVWKAEGDWILFGRTLQPARGRGTDERNPAHAGQEAAVDGGVEETAAHDFDAEEEKSPEQQFYDYISQYHLTPRESDVLEVLLHSDASMKDVAEKIGISERMLYRYMNQLYAKTGTESRVGLVKDYFEKNRSAQ